MNNLFKQLMSIIENGLMILETLTNDNEIQPIRIETVKVEAKIFKR